MANFALFSDTTAPQILGDGETGFVAAGVTLSVDFDVSRSDAIVATGFNNIVVFGSVNTHNANLINHSGSSLDLYVGAGGELSSIDGGSIRSAFASKVAIVNDGVISGSQSGLNLRASDDGGSINISNAGRISAQVNAILADAGTGALRITNTGTITASLATAIDNQGGDAFILNRGTIEGGQIGYDGGSGVDRIENFGTITGGVLTRDGNDIVINKGTIDTVSLGGGADWFDGRGGIVTGDVSGGRGSDTYRIDQNAITLIELAGQGIDRVVTQFDHSLADNFENLKLTGKTDVDGTGNSGRNVLTGNSGANELKGLQGGDTLIGLGGKDILRGGRGDDTLSGGDGRDILIGGIGKDTLTGGAGRDLFVFNQAKDSPNTDDFSVILDFEIGIDRIDLSGLAAGDITFIGNGFFTGNGPEVRVSTNGDKTNIRIDLDLDRSPDMRITLANVSGIQESDFIL